MSFLRVLSSAVLLWFTTLSIAGAHEVFPSILNLRADDGIILIEIDVNAEAMLAGVDLSAVTDTNDAENGDDYDSLRALTPQDIADRFDAYWPTFADNLTLLADGEPISFRDNGTIVYPAESDEVPRETRLSIAGTYPEDATTFEIGWITEYGMLIVRQNDIGIAPYTGTLAGGEISPPFLINGGSALTGWQVFVDYIPVGFDHIVPKGLDHILFVLGLFFLAARFRPLIIQISLFTLAHTITLALAALGYVNISGAIVEPLIAASIVFVAVENVFARGISRWRPFIIFGFGLLHGLGFASVLAEFGLPDESFVPALIGFNIGVEVGQLAVVTVMFLCVWQALRVDRGENEVGQGFAVYAVLLVAAIALIALNPASMVMMLESPVWLFAAPLAGVFILCIASIQFRDQVEAYRKIVAIPSSIAIAFVGAYWFVERVFL